MKRRLILPTFAIAYTVIAGCHTDPAKAPTSRPAATQSWTVKPIVVPGGPVVTPVKSGVPPLAYLVESGATVRIVEVESNRTLVEQAVDHRTVIGIIADKGITFDSKQVVEGPLKPSNHYAIYIVGDTTNESRNGMLRGEPTSRRSQD